MPAPSSPEPTAPGPASDRVTVRRGAGRADYDRHRVHAVLDAGLVAHVGVATPRGPVVLPFAYGRVGDTLYLHGAVGNALLGESDEGELCATVTIVDGLVVARTPFHHSMNYRSVVVRGRGRAVTDPDEVLRALRAVSDHVVATWELQRPVSTSDLRRTRVVALSLDEVSAKVRDGDPIDEPEDLAGPHWAGTVPIRSVFDEPRPAADLVGAPPVPAPVAALAGRPVSAASR